MRYVLPFAVGVAAGYSAGGLAELAGAGDVAATLLAFVVAATVTFLAGLMLWSVR